MLKFMATVQRLNHVSHEELIHMWENVHAPHIVDLVKPERYRITFFDTAADSGDSHPDGMAELWFRDMRHFETSRVDIRLSNANASRPRTWYLWSGEISNIPQPVRTA